MESGTHCIYCLRNMLDATLWCMPYYGIAYELNVCVVQEMHALAASMATHQIDLLTLETCKCTACKEGGVTACVLLVRWLCTACALLCHTAGCFCTACKEGDVAACVLLVRWLCTACALLCHTAGCFCTACKEGDVAACVLLLYCL
jgi:hypothetical protein